MSAGNLPLPAAAVVAANATNVTAGLARKACVLSVVFQFARISTGSAVIRMGDNLPRDRKRLIRKAGPERAPSDRAVASPANSSWLEPALA